MTCWVIIPVKGLRAGKSRLESVLDSLERYDLNRTLFLHVFTAASEVVGASRILVVSPDAEAHALAQTCGAEAVAESGAGGLNAALRQACRNAESRGAASVMVLAGDLPLIEAGDVKALLEGLKTSPCVIAPDRAGQGTNALIVPAAQADVFHFGEGSFVKHREAMSMRGLRFEVVRRPGLEFDLDTPADYGDLKRAGERQPCRRPAARDQG